MKVTFQINAKHLTNVAGFLKGISDPYAVVSLIYTEQGTAHEKPTFLGKTEVVKNSLNPSWVTTFALDYDVGSPVNVLVKIFDEVPKGEDVPMGSSVFTIAEVLDRKDQIKIQQMKKSDGIVQLRILPQNDDEGKLFLKMSGSGLMNKEGMFRVSDPFYEIFKRRQGKLGAEWDVVHRSPVIRNDLNPEWPQEEIDLKVLCDCDLEQVFVLKVFDYESSGEHVLMGEVETSVNALVSARKESRPLQLTEEGRDTGRLGVDMAFSIS